MIFFKIPVKIVEKTTGAHITRPNCALDSKDKVLSKDCSYKDLFAGV